MDPGGTLVLPADQDRPAWDAAAIAALHACPATTGCTPRAPRYTPGWAATSSPAPPTGAPPTPRPRFRTRPPNTAMRWSWSGRRPRLR
jgi:hypothetical protein